MPNVLVVYCHPNPKSFTRAVCDALLAGLADAGATVRLVDLHAEGFDPVLVVDEEHRRRDLDRVPQTAPYREALAWCDAMVFVYPMWWGGFPAMLKGFIDRVFVSGLAYTFRGRPKDAVLPTGLLHDKEAHFYYTLDAPALVGLLDPGWLSSYLAVFRYCGVRRVRRRYLARLKLTSSDDRARWLAEVRRSAATIGRA